MEVSKMAKKTEKQRNFLAIFGTVAYAVAIAIMVFRLAYTRYAFDDIAFILVMSSIMLLLAIMLNLLLGGFRKKPVASSIIFWLFLCPGLLLFAIFSCFHASSGIGLGIGAVIYPDNDPYNAQIIESLTRFNPFNSYEHIYLTEWNISANGVVVCYGFDGDILEFHKLYYGNEDAFRVTADSALAILLNQSFEYSLGERRSQQICYMQELLSDWPLPEHVVLTGKIGLVMDAYLSDVVGD